MNATRHLVYDYLQLGLFLTIERLTAEADAGWEEVGLAARRWMWGEV